VLRGRRELKRLTRAGIENARRDFTHALELKPDAALAHVGLSEAYALTFEATRLDAVCDVRALADATHHAHKAIKIDPKLADAWSALGFALCLSGDDKAGTAAAARAVSLAPEVTQHRILLGYASWGDDRIDAAQWVLSRSPGLALAYWLHATVLIARGALEAALTVIVAGCAAQDKQPIDSSVYSAVGLHLLHGLVLAALGRMDEAIEAFNRELRTPDRGQIYSRQCLANTWYALGAVQRRRGDIRAANMAFERALHIAPGHLICMAALGRPIPDLHPTDPRCVDAGVAGAVFQARAGRHAAARNAYRALLCSPHVANAGWMLPVEPILDATARPDIWSDLLTIVQQRAI
jgi:tetratricopeptide (TPR) repeat protein